MKRSGKIIYEQPGELFDGDIIENDQFIFIKMYNTFLKCKNTANKQRLRYAHLSLIKSGKRF